MLETTWEATHVSKWHGYLKIASMIYLNINARLRKETELTRKTTKNAV